MALGIGQYGIVERRKDGTTLIVRPARNGGEVTEVEVASAFMETYRLATGDVVEGVTEPLETNPMASERGLSFEDLERWDEQIDEPMALRGITMMRELETWRVPSERLVTVQRINGLALAEAEDRPFPRTKRSHSERTLPERLLSLATGPHDLTGRMLDFAAPLGAGMIGAIRGAHGSGLTRTLRAVLKGIVTNAADCVPIVLLLRARSEEITDWRRQFPQADLVVCPSAAGGASAAETLRLCDLVLEAAQRQTELGRDVVMLIDSLTGLWGAMLEAESADAQREADQSAARRRIREWVQKAGCFHGETPLGGSLGGSLTIIGTVWSLPLDTEAEEEGEIHPHLRLMEQIGPETAWQVVLSEALSGQRLYPAIDVTASYSRDEDRLLPTDALERLRTARNVLPHRDPIAAYLQLMETLEETEGAKSERG